MNLGELLGRIQEPLKLPEQPMETLGPPPMSYTQAKLPMGRQGAIDAQNEYEQGRRASELQVLKARMGNLGSWAVEPGILQEHTNGMRPPGLADQIDSVLAGKGLAEPGNELGTYSPLFDEINTYSPPSPAGEQYAGDVNPYAKEHEFRHRAMAKWGINELGNRLLDTYSARMLPEGPEYKAIKDFETFFAKYPELQTTEDDTLVEQILAQYGIFATPGHKKAARINELADQFFANPQNTKAYQKNFFEDAFE